MGRSIYRIDKPVDNSEYNGDQQVLKAYNAWDCAGIKTYSGSAIASGCDGAANPGQFEITSPGTYYLLFRTGGAIWFRRNCYRQLIPNSYELIIDSKIRMID